MQNNTWFEIVKPKAMGNIRSKTTVCFKIKTTWHAIARLYNEQASKHGLSASIGYVLLNIDAELGTPATKIGPLIGAESRSLTRMLKNLEESGLIYKEQGSTDKRFVRVYLTKKGIEKREIAKQVVKRFNQVLKESIPEEKLADFFEVLNKINQIIETENIYKSENSF